MMFLAGRRASRGLCTLLEDPTPPNQSIFCDHRHAQTLLASFDLGQNANKGEGTGRAVQEVREQASITFLHLEGHRIGCDGVKRVADSTRELASLTFFSPRAQWR
mmetsp:Transcript_2359/g.3775  ORF Transcript_2359/g.3775 Transcript_2359/m.3775 type:complete len:105 (+) Transcript_2359:72-386(+)